MTDLELTRLAAEAIGWNFVEAGTLPDGSWHCSRYEDPSGEVAEWGYSWSPLYCDMHAMALVKKFKMHIGRTYSGNWYAEINNDDRAHGPDLNRCIVECIASMQSAISHV